MDPQTAGRLISDRTGALNEKSPTLNLSVGLPGFGESHDGRKAVAKGPYCSTTCWVIASSARMTVTK